jgi:hypothetical protein
VQVDLRSLIEHLNGSVLLIHLIACVGVQVWAWRSLVNRLRGATLTKLQAALRYAGWSFIPVLLWLGGSAAMFGVLQAALLACPVFGLSGLGTVLFAIRCALLPHPQDAT